MFLFTDDTSFPEGVSPNDFLQGKGYIFCYVFLILTILIFVLKKKSTHRPISTEITRDASTYNSAQPPGPANHPLVVDPTPANQMYEDVAPDTTPRSETCAVPRVPNVKSHQQSKARILSLRPCLWHRQSPERLISLTLHRKE